MIVPLTIGVMRLRHFTPAIKVLFWLIFISALADAINFSLHLYHINNLFVSRAYTVIEFTLLSLFFIRVLPSQKVRIMIRASILLFLIIASADLYYNGLDTVDSLPSSIASILLMIYALLGFFYLVAQPEHAKISSIPRFWFYTAILLYHACGLFLFIFSNYIKHHYVERMPGLFGINSINNIGYYILISIGFWKTKQA